MLNRVVPTTIRRSWSLIACRNLSLTTSLNQQPKQQQIVDPIQQLFVTKIREYNDKRKFVENLEETTLVLIEKTFSSSFFKDNRKMVWSMQRPKFAKASKTH